MKLFRSFYFAIQGIRSCMQTESNFRIHLFMALLAIVMGFCFNIDSWEWGFIIFSIALVLAMELINTAIETFCDEVQPNKNPGIKKVKDLSAGAVLLTALGSVCIGLYIFLPKIIYYLETI